MPDLIDNSKVQIPFEDVYAFTVLQFDVYEINVVVFVDKEAIDRYLASIGVDGGWGCWSPYPYKINSMGSRAENQPYIGRLGFVKGHISAEVAFHEMQHIVNFWVDMLDIPVGDYDEYIASVAGKFAHKFYTWFYEEKLDG